MMNNGTIFDPIATALEFLYEGHIYEMYRHDDDRWTLIRREEDKPNIPPVKEVCTDAGWKGVISATPINSEFKKFYGVDDVYNYLVGDENV